MLAFAITCRSCFAASAATLDVKVTKPTGCLNGDQRMSQNDFMFYYSYINIKFKAHPGNV